MDGDSAGMWECCFLGVVQGSVDHLGCSEENSSLATETLQCPITALTSTCETARGRSSENIICSCTWSSQERMSGLPRRGPSFLLSHRVGTSDMPVKWGTQNYCFFKAYFSWLIVWECNCTEKYLVSVLIFPSGAHSVNTQKSFRKCQVHEPCPSFKVW